MFPKMTPWLVYVILVTMVTVTLMTTPCCSDQHRLVVSTRTLEVNIGRAAYLDRYDLVISSVARGESCRVEVVMGDPISQRVGHIDPPIFDCDFLPKTVQYKHNGSPLLQEDKVKLLIHKFTDTHTYTEHVEICVKVKNTSHEVILTQALRPIVVPEYHGVSNVIDASALRFRHSSNPNVSCVVGFSTFFSPWPVAGHIVMGERRQVVESVKKNCREFLFMNLHYEHLKSPTPDVDYLPLTVELYDPALRDEVITERIYLPIHIKGAFPNAPPKASYVNMYIMDVDQFVLTPIIPGVISAEDYETRASQLIFNMSKPFKSGEGYLVHLDNHAKPIGSFLQADLDNHRIGYRPPSISFSTQRVYDAEFTVFDTHFSNSIPITLHVAVRPSDTRAPRVSINTGLTLLEGQSRQITSDHFKVVDKDNLFRVRMYVKGGPQHGTISVKGKHSVIFSMEDINNGDVVYKHDDSDSKRDRIELRISDGANTLMVSFFISIVPRDDTPPYLVNNLGLQINEGGMRKISEDMLLAHDADSLDSNIIFTVITSPAAGDIIRKIRPSDSGTKVFGFRQRDVMKGQIYYRHDGTETFRDKFTFTLQDHQTPPNQSETMEFKIIINPMNENPPQIDPAATRIMYVEETEVGYLKPSELKYTDVESPSADLIITITTPPYFVYNRGERDAGKLVATHNISRVEKDTDVPQVITFSQADIDHMKIAYIPPSTDIGPESRLVRMAYTVTDASGNKLYGQTFDIEIKPINNQIPEFLTNKLLVEEGGILGITTNQLSAQDVDTPINMLKFIVDAPPRYGTLQNDGRTLRQGSTFIIEDLQKKHIRYLHDGSDVVMDTMTLALTDGINQATKVISIEIVPIDDQAPTLSKNLRPQLIVSEGEDAVITTRILAATDGDTTEDSLVFLIVRQPRYGVLQLRGQPATKFTQKDVKDGEVNFLHTSGEIGTNTLKDFASFIISDQNFLAAADQPMYDLNITITPVNNQKPTVILGNPVFVAEGESFRFSEEFLTVSDPDSKTKEIRFIIAQQPTWGYIENTKPSPGSEKTNSGIRINSFNYGDILDGSINYIQANHKGVEPVRDQFSFHATDGKLKSDDETVMITIVPSNDEAPDLMLNDFSVIEGGQKIIDQSMLDAFDMDLPKNKLKFQISQPPEHGRIVRIVHTRRGLVETNADLISIDELHGGMKLMYKHDGSEIFHDRFAITVTDGKHEIKKECNISVQLHNDERPQLMKNAGIEMEYGDSALISSAVLQAKDDDNDDDELFYIIVEVPESGYLQHCPDPFSRTLTIDCEDIALGENFTQSDLDLNKIRYIHTSSLGNSNNDQFVFVLTDGTHKRMEETFDIQIRNVKNANIALLNKGMSVREGERVAISSNYLSASDESTKAEEIVFAIIKAPRLGRVENIKRRFVAISSFTQLDIASQNVVYHHLTKNDITEDSFTFTVTNGLSEAKDGEFHIMIQPMDKILPTLIKNILLEVLQGTEKTVTPLHLKATDPDTDAHNITYKVAKPPTYGRLYNRGVLVASGFTQNDIDLGYISYESDGSRAGLDNFLFTVTDSRHEGFLINGTLQEKPVMCSIFIKPLLDDAPRLVVNKVPDHLTPLANRQRYGYKLTNRLLRVVDSDSDSNGLMYTITAQPKHGQLENTAAKRFVRRRFTQKDLDDGSLVYVVNPKKSKHFADSFGFKVTDTRGNELKGQSFYMKWSQVEFETEDVVACENIGVLNIAVLRTGNVDQSAFVSITVKEISAKKGQDFVASSTSQIQFDPGESRAIWQLNILNDRLMEANEKIRLNLVDPTNTMLGKKRKLRLLIVNAHNDECPQYLGMVSRSTGSSVLTGDPLPVDFGNAGKTITYHNINNVPSKIDNTYLNTEAEKKTVSPVSRPQPSPSKKSRRAKAKRRRSKRNKGKKKTRRTARKSKSNRRGSGFFVTSPKNGIPYNIPQKCSASTNGLQIMYLDENTEYQLLKCDGRNWQKWIPPTNNDGTATTACQEGWYEYNGRCYVPVNERLSWNNGIAYNIPQKCSASTNGLQVMYQDENGQYQLLRCDGRNWKKWNPPTNNDGTAATGCQQGWYEYSGRCYVPVNERLSWNNAEEKCINTYNGHLATVQSKRHLRWLSEKMTKKNFWIGLNDKIERGVWEYSNKQPVKYYNWKGRKPKISRKSHKRNCVIVMRKRSKWRNKHCDRYESRFICEAPPTTMRDSSTSSSILHPGYSRRTTWQQQKRLRRLHAGFFFGNS